MESSRDAILGAAMQLFAERSVEEVRVEDLISQAGLSRRTFYKYFTSKEDVLAALYETLTGLLLAILQGAGEAGGATLGQLHVGLDAYLDFHMVSGPLLGFLLTHALRPESQLHVRRRWFREEVVKVLRTVTRDRSAEPLDPLLFHALLSMMEGLSLHLLESKSPEQELARAKGIVHAMADQLLGPRRTD